MIGCGCWLRRGKTVDVVDGEVTVFWRWNNVALRAAHHRPIESSGIIDEQIMYTTLLLSTVAI
jgi:hypothetical protein